MKLVIDRSKWARGSFSIDSGYLLNPHTGLMCCLGFEARCRGVTEGQLWWLQLPTDVVPLGEAPPEWLTELAPYRRDKRYGNDCYERQYAVADMNDARGIDEATRESWIAMAFTVWGPYTEVEFVDGAAEQAEKGSEP